jgi:hypothetical protein
LAFKQGDLIVTAKWIRTFSFKAVIAASLFISLPAAARDLDDSLGLHGAPEPKVQFRKGAGKPAPKSSSPLLTYRGGSVLYQAAAYSIFWGSSWNNASFAGDKITGVDRFFNGFSGSNYARTSTEYSDKLGFISPLATYNGHVIDSSTPPSRNPSVSSMVAEVCKVTANAPDSNGVYFVYTSTTAGQVNYCAWHSWGNCSNGAKVQVAYMPNLDGIAGCDPGDTTTGNSQGLAAIINVTAHEYLEAITDPRGAGWLDSTGQENADKCAWSFPPGDGLSTLTNGSRWKLQMEWSNAAFTAGTGLLNRSGQKACIY